MNNRWLLPILLAILVVIVIVIALFGTKIKNLASSPTTTPTASPTASPQAQATGAPAGAAATVVVATPSAQGGSTPLPGATAVPTIAGVTLGMITHTQHQYQTIQQQASAGNKAYTYFLNPYQVIQRNLPQYGFTGGFTITQPASPNPTPTPHTGQDGRPIVSFQIQWHNQTFAVDTAQVAKHGPGGIWMIVTILPASAT